MTIFGRLTERRALSYQQVWGTGGDWSSTVNTAGVAVTKENATSHITVLACIRLLADSVASLPIDTYRQTSNGRVQLRNPAWLDKPNPESTTFDFVRQVMFSLNVYGNAYLLIVRDPNTGYPIEVWALDPRRVRVERTNAGTITYVVDEKERFTWPDVLHVKGLCAPGALVGVSPIEAARQGIALSMAAEEYGARFFGQGATTSGVIELPTDAAPEMVAALRDAWANSHGGLKNSHRPGVITGGAKWVPISITPEDSQFIETRKLQVNEICRLFGVPPHMVADVSGSTSWGTGIEQQSIGFVTYTLMPWIRSLETSINLLTPRGQYSKFNVSAYLRGDSTAQAQVLNTYRNMGVLSINEVRRILDFEPIDTPGADDYLTPLNMAPIDQQPNEAA